MSFMFLIGNATRDVQTRNVNGANGPTAVCDIDLAINEGFGDRKTTKYYRVTAWGHTAEVLGQYVKKGTKLAVQCSTPEVQTYTKKDGTTGTTLISTLQTYEFLGGPKAENAAQPAAPAAANETNDDLPF